MPPWPSFSGRGDTPRRMPSTHARTRGRTAAAHTADPSCIRVCTNPISVKHLSSHACRETRVMVWVAHHHKRRRLGRRVLADAQPQRRGIAAQARRRVRLPAAANAHRRSHCTRQTASPHLYLKENCHVSYWGRLRVSERSSSCFGRHATVHMRMISFTRSRYYCAAQSRRQHSDKKPNAAS